jgi:hypothetical protein
MLIAGWTLFDDDSAALHAVMAEWTRTDKTAEERVRNLRYGTGRNGAVRLDAGTVVDDGDADVLTGGAGYDWFLFDAARDRATDLRDEAFTDDLPFIGE